MVGVVFKPYKMAGDHLWEAYTRRMTGVGTYFQERQCERVGIP